MPRREILLIFASSANIRTADLQILKQITQPWASMPRLLAPCLMLVKFGQNKYFFTICSSPIANSVIAFLKWQPCHFPVMHRGLWERVGGIRVNFSRIEYFYSFNKIWLSNMCLGVIWLIIVHFNEIIPYKPLKTAISCNVIIAC